MVATDLSEAASEAVQQADAYARSTGGELAVCHVIPNLAQVHMLFPQLNAKDAVEHGGLETLAVDAVANSVGAITGRTEDGFEVFVPEGTAYAEIARCAETWRATVLFVGGHGATGFANVMLGGVAEKVVRYAPCSVVVARASKNKGVVLVATDLSDPSLPALAAATAEAKRRGARLVAINAVDLGAPFAAWMSPFGATPIVPSPDALRDVCAAAKTTLNAALAQFGGEGEAFVEEGSALAVITGAVERFSPELLVVATHGRTGLSRVALGSVAEKLVRSATTSVLVVRGEVR